MYSNGRPLEEEEEEKKKKNIFSFHHNAPLFEACE
jgi:hypothetical protein